MRQPIGLTVHNKLNFSRETLASAGIPIPLNYKLENLDSVFITDNSGNEIASQLTPLAWWEDGKHIKWVHVQLMSQVAAHANNMYVMQFMGKNKLAHQKKFIANKKGKQITVNTGKLRFAIGGKEKLFAPIELLRNGQWHEISAERGGRPEMHLLTIAGTTLQWGQPEQINIERNGTESAIIYCTGAFVSDDGTASNFCYELRIEAVRNSAELKLTHRMIGKHEQNELQQLALCLPLDDYEQIELGNEETIKAFSDQPLQQGQAFGIVQESEDDAVIGLLDEENNQLNYRGRHRWWIGVTTDTGAIMATAQHFYQRYPKSLEVDNTGLNIGLLPGKSNVKDSFVPAEQMQPHYILREGESRTHHILLSYSESPVEPKIWQQQSEAFHQPMLVMAPWKWYTESKALGDLIPKSEEFPVYEQAVDESLAVYLGRRETMQLYGDRNFGDDQYTRAGSWNNGEYDYAHVAMLHFLRGGDTDWYDLVAQPYALHLMDIDVCHSGPGMGKVHQHTIWHNSEPPKLGSHAWLRGLLTYYCFSGDLFAKDTAIMIADRWSEKIMQQDNLEGTERGMTWPIISMLAAYQTFPEKRYLEAAERLVELVLSMQDPAEGNFTGSMDRPTTKDRWGTFVIGSPVIESLVMYYQSTGDLRAKDAIVLMARRLVRLNWLEDIGAWEYTHSMLKGNDRAHNAKTDKMVTPAVLYGYLYSGDEQLLSKAMAAFAYSEAIPAKNGKDLGQTYCFGIRIPALIKQAQKR